MKHTLTFDSLQLAFGTRMVLNNIYMQCETGRVTGLLGRNGSGKSCLMKIVFGSMPCAYKSVRIDGRTLTGCYLEQRHIGYLPQKGFIPASLTLRRVLALFRIPEQDVTAAFPEYRDFMTCTPADLSGGYLRVFESLVILLSPYKFCILYEPFSGLAPVQIDRLKNIINAMKCSRGIVITDHLHKHVTALADNLYLLAHGCTYAVRQPDDLVRWGYLSSL